MVYKRLYYFVCVPLLFRFFYLDLFVSYFNSFCCLIYLLRLHSHHIHDKAVYGYFFPISVIKSNFLAFSSSLKTSLLYFLLLLLYNRWPNMKQTTFCHEFLSSALSRMKMINFVLLYSENKLNGTSNITETTNLLSVQQFNSVFFSITPMGYIYVYL